MIIQQQLSGSSLIVTSQSVSSTSYTTLSTPDQVTGLVLPSPGLIAVWYQATWLESVAGDARAAIFIGSNQLQVAAMNTSPAGAPVTQAAASGNSAAAQAMSLSSTPTGLASLLNINYSGDAATGQVVGIVQAYNGTDSGHAYVEIAGLVQSVAEVSSQANLSLGGPCYIFAAAGTYTVSVRFKTSSGSVTASNRRLYAKVDTF